MISVTGMLGTRHVFEKKPVHRVKIPGVSSVSISSKK